MNDVLADDFLLELMKVCLLDRTVFEVVNEYLKDNYIPQEEHRTLWKEIRKYNSLHNKLPTPGVLSQILIKNEKVTDLIYEIKQMPLPTTELIIHQFEEFIKQRMFVDYYDNIADVYNKESKDKAYSLFTKRAEEFSNFTLAAGVTERVFANFNKRHVERLMSVDSDDPRKPIKIPFMIDELDDLTYGGAETGEFWLFLAESGKGKSQWLIHNVITAARCGLKAALFVGEGTKKQVMDRIDAAWTGTLYQDMKRGKIDEGKLKAMRVLIKSIGAGEIFVIVSEDFKPMKMSFVRSKFAELEKKYGKIGMIATDYLELFDPSEGQFNIAQEKQRQEILTREHKSLATSTNTLVISATQSGSIDPKDLENPDFVITHYNCADAKGKHRAVDGLITYNQTKDEMRENIARLHTDKIREHKSGQTLYIAQNYARSRFYDRKRTLDEFINVEKVDD